MKFKSDFFYHYLKEAPVPLAIERNLECEILSKLEFTRPILDLGCGEGLFAYILFDEKIDVGIDPNNKELSRAKKYGMYNELLSCKGNEIPRPDKCFNTIYSNSVLEHIPNIEEVLKEMYRLLSDNGSIYLTLPTNYFDQYSLINIILIKLGLKKFSVKYRRFFNSFWNHYHCYKIGDWRKLFEKHGFNVKKTIPYCSPKICLLNDMLTPFTIFNFINKKIFNRWILFKFIRKPLINIFKWCLNIEVIKKTDSKTAGLIFFQLCKK